MVVGYGEREEEEMVVGYGEREEEERGEENR